MAMPGSMECASVFPYMFPRDFAEILRYALNLAPQVRYRFADLPAFLPWLVRYYPRLLAATCVAQCDGRIAPDPAQPDRA